MVALQEKKDGISMVSWSVFANNRLYPSMACTTSVFFQRLPNMAYSLQRPPGSTVTKMDVAFLMLQLCCRSWGSSCGEFLEQAERLQYLFVISLV